MLHTPKPTEAELTRKLVDAAELGGWLVSHHPDSRRSLGGGGLPDLVMVHKTTGKVRFIEVKSEKGTLRARQALWGKALWAGGHDYKIVLPQNCDQVCRELLDERHTPSTSKLPEGHVSSFLESDDDGNWWVEGIIKYTCKADGFYEGTRVADNLRKMLEQTKPGPR